MIFRLPEVHGIHSVSAYGKEWSKFVKKHLYTRWFSLKTNHECLHDLVLNETITLRTRNVRCEKLFNSKFRILNSVIGFLLNCKATEENTAVLKSL